MSGRTRKTEFLAEIMSRTRSSGAGLDPLMTTDGFARDNVQIACEAIQLGLIRPFWDPEWSGYELRITRAGKLLLNGMIDEAAASIDAGKNLIRIAGPPPEGSLGAVLFPGGPGMELRGMAARHHAPEMMRGVATGHLRVGDGTIHAVKESPVPSATWGANVHASMRKETVLPERGAGPVETSDAGLPSSRAGRHVRSQGK
jgi:hypothetical protein